MQHPRSILAPVIAVMFFASFAWPSCLSGQIGEWVHIDSTCECIFRGIACADSIHCAVIGDSSGYKSLLRRSTDGGRSWKGILYDSLIFPDKPTKRFYRTLAHPKVGVFFVVCDSGIVLRTLNDGASWDTTRLPVGGSQAFGLSFRGDLGYLSAAPRSLFKTEDGGASWNSVDITLPDSLGGFAIFPVQLIDSETVVIRLKSKDETALGRSMDGGKTWEFIVTPQLRNCLAIAFPDRMHGWAVGGERTGVGDLEKDIIAATTDGGHSWEYQVYQAIPQAFGLRNVAFVDNRNGIAVGGNGKILRTSDGGRAWIQQQTGFDTADITNLLYLAYPSVGHAYTVSTNFVILAYRAQSSGVPRAAPELPALVAPNPTRHATVTIAIPDPDDVAARVEVIDLLGRVVATLEGGTLDESGRRRYRWDTGAMPSGLYFARWGGRAGARCVPIHVE